MVEEWYLGETDTGTMVCRSGMNAAVIETGGCGSIEAVVTDDVSLITDDYRLAFEGENFLEIYDDTQKTFSSQMVDEENKKGFQKIRLFSLLHQRHSFSIPMFLIVLEAFCS